MLNFVSQGLQPFAVVTLPAFRELIVGLQPGKTVLSRSTVRLRLSADVGALRARLIAAMAAVNCIATTTDCWSARGRALFGVTAHWIAPVTFERISAALACRPMKGAHTYDVIAVALDDIHRDYGIARKVCWTTTDSGSNFVKAFSVFGRHDGDGEEGDNDDDDDDDDDDGDAATAVIDIGALVDSGDGDIQLPMHHRCVCHTLQLVATTDADDADATPAYKRLSRAAFAKAQALWNRTGRSVQAAEAVQKHCGLALVRPNQTRWNSVFFAVERLVRIVRESREDALHSVCTDLKVPR